MPDLLLELFSEEIPARMQRQAADDLKRLVTGALVDADVALRGRAGFRDAAAARAACRRPAGGAARPQRGAQGAARRRARGRDPGLSQERRACAHRGREDRLRRQEGRVLCRRDREAGPRDARADRRDRARRSCARFPWPKSMRWGAASARSDALRWVRPLRSILCTFGGPHEAPETIAFALDGLTAGDATYGHRFLAPAPITVRRFEDYVDALYKAKVVLDADRRKQIILADAKSLAFAQGLELVEDEGLLEEVAGPRRMAGRADGRVRGRVPGNPARGDPRDDPRQPEMFRAARRDGQARQQVHPGLQPGRERRRHGDRGGQRPRRARAAVGRAPFLAHRPRRRCPTTRTRPKSRSTSGSRS